MPELIRRATMAEIGLVRLEGSGGQAIQWSMIENQVLVMFFIL